MNEYANTDLASACSAWQGGRNIGSTPLRGAARVLTGIPHYFQADFITRQETAARANTDILEKARILLDAVAAAEHRTADEWNTSVGLYPRGFAGRGLEPKPQDDQILEVLATGRIVMPLWGVSLSRYAAWWYGTAGKSPKPRFMFEIDGPFPAIPSWTLSGERADEEELICGGEYEIRDVVHDDGPLTTVIIRFLQPISIF